MNESKKQEMTDGAHAGAAAPVTPERRRALLRTAACSVPMLVVSAPSIADVSSTHRAPTPRVSPGNLRPTVAPLGRASGGPVAGQSIGPAREIAQAMNKFR